jgi:hypothetical protein
MKKFFMILCLIMPVLLAAQKYIHTHVPYDKKLAAKYGLKIREPLVQLEPAPEWLHNIDMIFADWTVTADMQNKPFKLWKGYRIELKDTLVEKIVRLQPLYGRVKVNEQKPVTIDGKFDGSDINGVKLISHVPHSKTGFKQAHEQGFKVIPYVHFTDIHSYYADQEVFLFQHPEILLKDDNGKWVHLPMDGTDRMYRYLVCANSPSYWKLSLAYVKKLMDWGADGVFIDNVGTRKPCFAPKFTNLNPEFDPYIHEHLFPEASHNYAFDRFLQAIRFLVKSYGDDKVIVLNSGIGTELQKNGDGCMIESFIYSWAWEGRNQNHTWTNIKKRIEKNESFMKTGRLITALSYLDPTRKEVKDDAFWAFSAARLLEVIWWSNLENTGAGRLYQAHMGECLQPLQEIGKIAYRTFENGIIVLNDSAGNKTLTINLPTEFRHKKLLDFYDGKRQVEVVNNQIEVTVPMQSSRIYLVIND